MKYIDLAGFGDESVLQLAQGRAPSRKYGQVRIAVKAAGINRADLVQRKGFYPPPAGESEVLGLEISGVVVEVGDEVTGYKMGDRVFALLAGGGYAEEVTVDAGLVMPLPASMNFEEGAASAETFLTAHHNLFTLGQLTSGKTALIHAGASGVGTSAIQLCREMGVDSFATVGTLQKKVACEKLGAKAINYNEGDFADWVLKETQGRGVDLILDPVGAYYFERNMACLARQGILIQIAFMTGAKVSLNLSELMRKQITLRGSTLRGLALDEKRAVVKEFWSQFGEKLAHRQIIPLVETVLSFEQVQAAHRRMEENKNIGKIVLKWN